MQAGLFNLPCSRQRARSPHESTPVHSTNMLNVQMFNAQCSEKFTGTAMPMAGEPTRASHPTRAARLRFCTPPHTTTAAKLGQVAAPPRTRDSRTPDF